MHKPKDRWFRLFGIPAIAIIANTLFYWDSFTRLKIPIWKSYGSALVVTSVLWEVNRQWVLCARKWYPGFSNTRQRIMVQLVLFFITTLGLELGFIYLLNFLQIWTGSPMLEDSYYHIVVGLTFTLLVGLVYEIIYFLQQWQLLRLEAEHLKQKYLQTQLDSLKSQVNPHFLFNSLNTLSSLIHEDKKKAGVFVDDLAQVYRYLLQSNEKELVPLREELTFLKAYFFLHKVRFGEGIQLEVIIHDAFLEDQLPPLTMQLLLENAVRHNVVNPASPLCIKVYISTDDHLVVMNNLNRKKQSVVSKQTGLSNLSTKYRLLNQHHLMIRETKDTFEVRLPLIKKTAS